MPKVLFSSTLFTPFIEEDFHTLSALFTVERLIASGVSALIRLPFAVMRSDITFTWFGSVYSGYTVFLARLFHKKSIIVVAGVDASRDREIDYGIWLTPWKARVVRYAYRHADRVLPVDQFLENEVRRLADYEGKNLKTIPFGYDGNEWQGGGPKEDLVLTVASCENESRLRKKGIDKLIDAARRLNTLRFQIIGIQPSLIQKMSVPANVEIIPFIPQRELLPYYQRAKVYCQPSFTEGLPNTLCEAMLCGCIPVGTIAGGIPTAIGENGFLVSYRDQEGLVRALKEAMTSPTDRGLAARTRILQEFPRGRRLEALRQQVMELSS
jgi:glycosyltransferase involved in cell wall biosynthesis